MLDGCNLMGGRMATKPWSEMDQKEKLEDLNVRLTWLQGVAEGNQRMLARRLDVVSEAVGILKHELAELRAKYE